MKTGVRPASVHDVLTLAARIPPEDALDLKRGWNVEPEEALRLMMDAGGECRSFLYKGELAAVFGIQRDGNAWLMRSETMKLPGAALYFVRHAGGITNRWLKRYGHIEGWINERYTKFIRWFIHDGWDVEPLGNGYLRVKKTKKQASRSEA